MRVKVAEDQRDELIAFCRDYLLSECAVGSDAGLCVAEAAMVSTEIQQFGRRAKTEVFTQQQSRELAARHGFFPEGLTGDQGGVIGALAAVGLRAEGRDGRFIGLRGIRDLAIEDYSLAQLQTQTDIEAVQTIDDASTFVAGAHYDLPTDTRLHLSAARKIKIPSINQLYDVSSGDPTLQFEHSFHYEAGAVQQLPGNSEIRIAGFLTDVSNYIEKKQ
ncbi:MAG: TonB-dependent receptor domain-containing protein [Gammaproteobacteria bacterium]